MELTGVNASTKLSTFYGQSKKSEWSAKNERCYQEVLKTIATVEKEIGRKVGPVLEWLEKYDSAMKELNDEINTAVLDGDYFKTVSLLKNYEKAHRNAIKNSEKGQDMEKLRPEIENVKEVFKNAGIPVTVSKVEACLPDKPISKDIKSKRNS